MTVLFLVFLNLFVAAIIYLALSLKLTRITQSNLQKKLQDEFRAIIDEFNQTAETNISLLERRLYQVNSALNRAQQMPVSEASTAQGSNHEQGSQGVNGGAGSFHSSIATTAFGLDVTLNGEELDYLLTDKGLSNSSLDSPEKGQGTDPLEPATDDSFAQGQDSSLAQEGKDNWSEKELVGAAMQDLHHKQEALGAEAASPSLGERVLDGLVAMETKAVFALQKWFQRQGTQKTSKEAPRQVSQASPAHFSKDEEATAQPPQTRESEAKQTAFAGGQDDKFPEDPLERQTLYRRLVEQAEPQEAELQASKASEEGYSAKLKREIDKNFGQIPSAGAVDFWSEDAAEVISSSSKKYEQQDVSVGSDQEDLDQPGPMQVTKKETDTFSQRDEQAQEDADFGDAERLIRSDLSKIREYLDQSRQEQDSHSSNRGATKVATQPSHKQKAAKEQQAKEKERRSVHGVDRDDDEEESEEKVEVLNEKTAALPADFWQRSRDERVSHIAHLLNQGHSIKDLSALTNMSFGEIELIASLNKKPI